MTTHKKIFKDTNLFLGFSILTNLFNFARNFAVAKLLGPYLTGLCMSLLLVPQILAYLNLGLPNAMTFLLPYKKSKNEHHRALDIQNEIFSFTTLTAFITLMGIILFIVIFRPHGLKTYLLYTAIFAFLGQYVRYFTAYYAATSAFFKVGMAELVYASILLSTSVLLIRPLKVHGFWLSMIISIIVVAAYYFYDYTRNEKISLTKFSYAEILSLSSTGLTMSLTSVIYIPFVNLSKIFITFASDVKDVGYFVLAVSIISLMAIIPKTISRVFMPHMSTLSGGGNTPEVYPVFVKIQLYTLLLTSLAAALGYFLIEPLVSTYLSQYTAGIPAAKIMLFAGIPYSLIDNANNMLVASYNKKMLIRIFIAALLLNTIIYISMLFYKINISLISASFIVVFSSYALLLHLYIIKNFRKNYQEI